jgi:hypothetical protein
MAGCMEGRGRSRERDRNTQRSGGWSHGASSQGGYRRGRDGTPPKARDAEEYDERRAL